MVGCIQAKNERDRPRLPDRTEKAREAMKSGGPNLQPKTFALRVVAMTVIAPLLFAPPA